MRIIFFCCLAACVLFFGFVCPWYFIDISMVDSADGRNFWLKICMIEIYQFMACSYIFV